MHFKKVQWLGILATLLGIKFLYFYFSMEIKTNFIGAWLLSVCVMFLLIFIIEKAALNRWFGLLVYLLLSMLLVVDAVYYRHFYQYFTLNLLGQAFQISSVSGSVKMLLKPLDILLIADLPLVYLYFKQLEPRAFNKKKAFKLCFQMILILMVLVAGLFNPIESDYLTSLKNQEFISYHLKDLIQVTINVSDIRANAEEFEIDQLKPAMAVNQPAYYGIGKERNVILVQVESLQQMMLNAHYEGEVITPNLNALIERDSIYFEHYYQQLGRGNTSDAEFASLNSLLPPTHGQAYSLYSKNEYFGLPWILRELGYSATAYHGFQPEFWNREEAYPQQGFERFYSESDYAGTDPIGFGINDEEFFEQTIEYMKTKKGPFFSFVVTLSSHIPFDIPDHFKSLPRRKEETMFDDYVQSIHYTDACIGKFIQTLKDEGLYEDSIIVFYGDHFGLNKKDEEIRMQVEGFLNRPYDYDEMLNIPLIIHIPGSDLCLKPEITGAQVDLMPTLLNLLGLESNQYFFLGQDLLNADEGFFISQTYLTKGSFIDDQVVFEMSRDGVFSNSRVWLRDDGKPTSIEGYKYKTLRAMEVIDRCNYALQHDLIDDWILKYHKPIQ